MQQPAEEESRHTGSTQGAEGPRPCQVITFFLDHQEETCTALGHCARGEPCCCDRNLLRGLFTDLFTGTQNAPRGVRQET